MNIYIYNNITILPFLNRHDIERRCANADALCQQSSNAIYASHDGGQGYHIIT